MKSFKEFFIERNGEMKYVWGDEYEDNLTINLRMFDTMADYMDYIAAEQTRPALVPAGFEDMSAGGINWVHGDPGKWAR